MTKQEMAEWLAENVLGFKSSAWGHDRAFKGWQEPDGIYFTDLKGFIYSPDGFFAVWDAVNHQAFLENWEGVPTTVARHQHNQKRSQMKILWHEVMEEIYTNGKDRYEAFYNAVYEAMK